MMRYLRKANDDLVSFCRCEPQKALITAPAQMDCPWCGCGWLFTCIECRKAFTFAEAVEIEESREELALRDLQGFGLGKPTKQDVTEWVEGMESLLADIAPGTKYVYLDGLLFPHDLRNVRFDGWHARHEFDVLPHHAALTDRSVLDQTISSGKYWSSRQLAPDTT